MRIGFDVGSTTIKCVALDDNNEVVYKSYERHFSLIAEKAAAMLGEIHKNFPEIDSVPVVVSGSAGLGRARHRESAKHTLCPRSFCHQDSSRR